MVTLAYCIETVWKVVEVEAIMDTRVKAVVEFHDFLHGFRPQRGTGTAILEVKLAQELACVEQVPLYLVFLSPPRGNWSRYTPHANSSKLISLSPSSIHH